MDWNTADTENNINMSINSNSSNISNDVNDSNQAVEDDFAHMNASINLNHLSQLIGSGELMSADNIELMSGASSTAPVNSASGDENIQSKEHDQDVKGNSETSKVDNNSAGISTIMMLDQKEDDEEKLIQLALSNNENSLDFSSENIIKHHGDQENDEEDENEEIQDNQDDEEEAGKEEALSSSLCDKTAIESTSASARFNYKCRYCLHLTKFKARIIEHMLTVHNVNLMQCPYDNCGRKFKDEWKLKRHLVSNKDHAKLGTFQSLADSIRQHCLVTPQKIGQYPCPMCHVDGVANDQQMISNLEEQQAVIATFLSKNTDNSLYFDKYDDLKDHLTHSHPNFNIDYYFVCKQCGQVFLNRYKLSCHLFNVHSGKRKRRSSSTAASRANKLMATGTDSSSAAFINFGNHVQQFAGHQGMLTTQFGLPQAQFLVNKPARMNKSNASASSSSTSSMMMLHNGSYVTPAKFLLDCRKFLCVICDRKFKRVRDLQSHVQIMHKTISDEQREQLKVEIDKTNSLIVKAKSMRNKKVKETPSHQQIANTVAPTISNTILDNNASMSSSKSYLLNNQQLINMGSLILSNNNPVNQIQPVHHHQQQQPPQQSLPVQFVKLCFICNKMFKVNDDGKTDKSFVRHMQIQHGMNEKGERLVDCPVCEKWFFNRQQMERHMRTHQVWIPMNSLSLSSSPTTMGPNEFKEKHSILYCHECAECHLFFKSLKVLTKHKMDAHNLKPVFECCFGKEDDSESVASSANCCQLQFEVDQIDAYLEHARIHPQKNITCLKCQIKFANKNSLRNHMKNVHYKLNTSARKRVSRPRQRKEQLLAAGPSLNAAASIVNLSGPFNVAAAYAVAAANVANSNNHLATHSKSILKQSDVKSNNVASYLNAAFPSSVVNQSGNARSNSSSIVVSLNGPESPSQPDQHICATCGKEFNSRNSLHNHLATHNTSDLKLFLCQACGASYKTRAELSKHVGEEHESLKHKTCIDCGETFKTSFHLKRHMLTRHSNIRPFRCNHCSMTFARKDKLKQHEAKHINHPLYSCSECGKGFYRKEHLKDHEISKHSKQYPFSCEYCAKGFVHAKDLHRHIRVRHLNAVLGDAAKSESLGLTTTKQSKQKNHQSFQIPKINYQPNNQQILLENMFNQRLISNQLPANSVGYASKASTANTSVAQLAYNQSIQQASQPAANITVSTASDFKSKKISSILKSNAAASTTSINNYPTLDLSSVQSTTANNTIVTHHLNPNTTTRFITSNDFNAAAGNVASLDPTTGNVIYNQQLISIPIHELSNNPNQFINSQQSSNQRVNTSVSLKIRDQLNNKFNEPSNHELVKQQQAQSTQILSHAKINNILNGLDTTSSSTQLVDNTNVASSTTTSKSSMKTFKCPQCNKCFFYENYLRKHMLSKHSQSPLFSCSYCGKGFSNKSNAKSHVNNSHLDYSCPICGKMFKSKSLAVRHMQAAHNVDANSTLNKQFQPIKHVKMDVKILESGTTNNIVSNNNSANNILMATTNNAGSIIIDNGSLQQHHNSGILNLIPISGTLDLSSLGAHAGPGDVMDLNGNFHTTGTDLNNNINIINLSFENSGIKSTSTGGAATNYVNDLSSLTSQSIQTNGGSGNIAVLPSTFTLNFLNNQQPTNQQQTFVLNQTGFGQQQQQQHHQQTGNNNTTLNSASYFI